MNILIRGIRTLMSLIEFLLVIRIFMSMLRIGYDSFIGEFVYELTEPLLRPARKLLDIIGLNNGPFDFSYIVAVFILRIINSVLLTMAIKLGGI